MASTSAAAVATSAAGPAASLSTAAAPAIHMITIGKDSVVVLEHDVLGRTFGKRVAELPAAEETQWSPDGRFLAVLRKDSLAVFAVKADGSLGDAQVIPEEDVAAVSFSPLSTRLVTLRRRKAAGDEAPNLRVWDLASVTEVAAMRVKPAFGPEDWPALQWTGDERFACRMSGEGLLILDGKTLAPAEVGSRIPTAQRFWVCPANVSSGKRSSVVTFIPRTKSKPAAVCVWSLPPSPVPVASRNLEADSCRVEFNADGTAVLVEMSTSTSATSYYGDSRLFLFSTDGKIAVPVPQAKEGPVSDFAFNPVDPAQFLLIAGRSPPQGTLHTLPKGEAVFSFGTGAFNTIKYQPQGRAVLLGGFGNMGGDVQVWDTVKFKPFSPVFNTPVATAVAWAPDGRTLLAATTRPRLMVDNGVRMWTLRGELLAHSPADALFHASWRPAPAGVFPDRPISPLARRPVGAAGAAGAAASAATAGSGGAAVGGAGAGAAGGAGAAAAAPSALAPAAKAAAAAKPASSGGKYVPPHLRGAGGAAVATSVVAAAMSEGTKKAERLVGPGSAAAAAAAPPVRVIPGMDPADAKKKRKRKPKNKAPGPDGGAAAASDDGED